MAAALAAGQQPAPALAVARATLHYRQEGGPPISETYQYYSGELLYLSFRIAGFRVVKDCVDLRWQVFGVDPEGRLLAPPANGEIQEEVSFNDKDWLPKVQYTLALPGQLPPGPYKLKIRVSDEWAKASAEQEVEFKVGGKPLPAVKELTVLNLGFYRDELDREPMAEAAYRAGQTLVARFQVAGFELGAKNKFAVGYGLRILAPGGQAVFTQEEAASDEGEPFYPRRLLNGALTLNITEGVQAGEYTLVVVVRDKVGGKAAETGARFRVEK